MQRVLGRPHIPCSASTCSWVKTRLPAFHLRTLPPGVLLLVVLQVLAALDRLPPLRVVAVPLDRRADGLLELVPRRPAELALDLRRVDRVAAVVAGAVLDLRDALVPGLAH